MNHGESSQWLVECVFHSGRAQQVLAAGVARSERARLEPDSTSDAEPGASGRGGTVADPTSWYPGTDLPGLVTIGQPDLHLDLFVLGWNHDGLGTGRRDYYLVGFALLVMTGFLHGWDLVNFVAFGGDHYMLGLHFIVAGLDEYLLAVRLEISGDPLAGTGGVVAVGEAKAQTKGRTTKTSS